MSKKYFQEFNNAICNCILYNSKTSVSKIIITVNLVVLENIFLLLL